ncbi:hypothetical protein Sps_01446 [Shewanella psychrophila]|uniref:Uncharacterized protein n=1 Tax=Shewanella psychrophila TaxID=225848 RepID=A0A1S6HM82_9GAMM|nr:hypothetical protein [Shewanella psychrophila]AQS36612.1 hypothetical protein Sps_01446 [Shewanella psychrophila]
MKCVITAASEAHGRLIAYGGTGLWVFSNEVAAKARLARFAFDVFKYFDQADINASSNRSQNNEQYLRFNALLYR